MFCDNYLNQNVLETSWHEYVYHHGVLSEAELANECVQLNIKFYYITVFVKNAIVQNFGKIICFSVDLLFFLWGAS